MLPKTPLFGRLLVRNPPRYYVPMKGQELPLQRRNSQQTLTYRQTGGGKRSFKTQAHRLISDTTAILCTSGSSDRVHTSTERDIMSAHWGINTSVNWTTQPKSITTWWRAPAWRRSITNIWGCGGCNEEKNVSVTLSQFIIVKGIHCLSILVWGLGLPCE